MKTWAKQLEEALPNAAKSVYWIIMDTFCPFEVFPDGVAPTLTVGVPSDVEVCEKCWESCESKCFYEMGEKDED